MMRNVMAVALLLVGTTLVGAQTQTGSISGRVTDASGAPIQGAFVRAQATSGGGGPSWGNVDFTDQNGDYLIDDVEVGNYDVSARKFGLGQAQMSADVLDGMTTVVDFTIMAPVTSSVSGTVSGAATGDPVEGARVILRSTSGGFWGWRFAVTDAAGAYVLENVLDGDYELSVRKFGFEPGGPVAVTVAGADATVDVSLNAPAVGSVSGTVTDMVTGDPIEGAWVIALRMSNWGWRVTRTDAMGAYELNDIRTGSYLVHVRKFGFLPAGTMADVVEGMVTPVDVALEPRP